MLLICIKQGRVKVAIAQDNLKEIEDRLEALLLFDNKNHWALAEQGWLLFKNGNIGNAVRLLEQAVEVCGDNSTYRRRLVCCSLLRDSDAFLFWHLNVNTISRRMLSRNLHISKSDFL